MHTYFAGATVCVVTEKYLSVIVTGAAKSGRTGRDQMEKLKASGVDLSTFNLDVFVSEGRRGIFWPARSIADIYFKKMMEGDLGAFARLIMKLSQIQGLLAMIEAGLFLLCLIRIASAISESSALV